MFAYLVDFFSVCYGPLTSLPTTQHGSSDILTFQMREISERIVNRYFKYSVVRHPSSCLSSRSVSSCSAKVIWLVVWGLTDEPLVLRVCGGRCCVPEHWEDFPAFFSDGKCCPVKPCIPPAQAPRLGSLILLHVGIHSQFLK